MDTVVSPSSQNFRAGYLFGDSAIYQPGDTFGPRQLVDFEIVWIIAGSAVYHHDGKAEHLPAGAVLLGRPGFDELYQWDRHALSHHAFVHFDIERQPTDWPRRSDWPVICDAANRGLARGLLRKLMSLTGARLNIAKRAPSEREQRLLAALLDVLIMPSPQEVTDRGERLPSAVRRALDAIVANLEQDRCPPLDLDDLAGAARVSRTHLTRLFRQHVGRTPVAAVQLARLDRALTLLERSNLSISEIADRLGFASPYHFSRRFSQAFGLPPSRMRQQLRLADQHPAPRMPLAHTLTLP